MSFTCRVCNLLKSLGSLADLPCSCLMCDACACTSIQKHFYSDPSKASATPPPPPRPAPQRAPVAIELGDVVLYRTADGNFVEATVEVVDISVMPPQYGIQLVGASNLRFTEQERLIATKSGVGSPSPPWSTSPQPPQLQQQQQQQGQVSSLLHSARCACCAAPLPPDVVRALAPEIVAAWEADRTASWLKVHDVIACPHRGCGALIQRVPHSASKAPAAPAAHATAHRAGTSGAAAAAVAHRDQHRYRCGACGRDFCDSCLAAPYHTGFTCRQARAPDCLLCGGKVEEDRLEKLLPCAAACVSNATDVSEGGRLGEDAASTGPRRSARLRGVAATASTVSGGHRSATTTASGVRAAASGKSGREESAVAALLCHATNAELRSALKNKLEVDTVWCLERSDLEKAMLHWGGRTCSAPDCAAKLRAMCTRPLPCGHWCCGLRGEGEGDAATSHPRCVECGASSNPADQAGEAAMAAAISDCCFCWEPLVSGPCIQMACGPRHICHLQCALDRLHVGFPGPHISFTHLYCPLCRSADGGEGRPSGAMQSALAGVHLEHPALAAALKPHLDLRAEVVAAVRARLRLDQELKAEPDLQPGGRYDGRPADFGLERLLFYKCGKCSKPYFGGRRACGAGPAAADNAAQGGQQARPRQPQGAAAGGAGANPAAQQQQAQQEQELVCGECCARSCGANCPRHGTTYIEWKCKYCCSLASWFCFGTTHMCEPCHSKVAQGTLPQVPRSSSSTCTDPNCGLKATPHPPPGQEACLGCGMCRGGL